MQIIYNITLTLWVLVVVLKQIDIVAFGCDASPWFYRVSGAVVLAAMLLSIASALAWIWS